MGLWAAAGGGLGVELIPEAQTQKVELNPQGLWRMRFFQKEALATFQVTVSLYWGKTVSSNLIFYSFPGMIGSICSAIKC